MIREFKNNLFKYFVVFCFIFASVFSYIFLYHSSVKQDVHLKVEIGDSLSNIIPIMIKNDIISSGYLLKFFMYLTFTKNNLMFGNYIIPKGASIWRIKNIITSGKNFQYSITIPEGLTVKQIIELLNSNKRLIGKISVKFKDGELIPNTYFFEQNATRDSILIKMQESMKRIIDNEWKNRTVDTNLIKSKRDAIILASIVEKETSIDNEKPIVASVLVNRLKQKMKLQVDPTVVYAVTNGYGHMKGKALYNKHLKVDNPYNTYLYYGLPKGAICNPGIKSIKAVLHPAKTNYLYFVANGKGGHVFSETLEDHEKNREIWRNYKKQLNDK